MIWQDHRVIAGGLRDQACADLLAARYLLLSRNFTINDQPTSFAHIVMAKCQQACEKLLKGFFLFSDRGFDPTAGHRPMTDTTELTEHQLRRRESFFVAVNRGNSRIVSELKWIEGHAPLRALSSDFSTGIRSLAIWMSSQWHDQFAVLAIRCALLTARENRTRRLSRVAFPIPPTNCRHIILTNRFLTVCAMLPMQSAPHFSSRECSCTERFTSFRYGLSSFPW
jgi:hypothetical protein